MMQLQSSDPIFSMGVDVRRPAYNFETKYRVTTLTKEQWTWDSTYTSGAHLIYRWVQDGGRVRSLRAFCRRLSVSLGTYVTVLQAQINAMLACANEIHVDVRPEKHVSTCSDGGARWRSG